MKEKKSEPIVTNYAADLRIGDFIIPCAVLPDGTRVLSQRGIFKTFGGGRPGGRQWKKRDEESDDVLVPVFLTADNLKPFISKELITASEEPILYRARGGSPAHGIVATALNDICEVWLKARDAGVLKPKQKKMAVIADVLTRSLARVAIDALIDEATGYQDVRNRFALQRLLEKYLSEEWAKWTKTFPDDFYRELFRVREIPYPPLNMNKPSYVGHWTNNIVYSRLAPKVLDRLRELNPRLESGHRARKHHQHLTRDYGYQELQKHLHTVTTLLKLTPAGGWRRFVANLNRAFPQLNNTFEIPLDDKDD